MDFYFLGVVPDSHFILNKDIVNNNDVLKLDVSSISPGSYLLNCKTAEGIVLNSISFVKIN